MSQDLSWKLHYELLSSRAYKMLGLLRRTFVRVNCTTTKRALYQSMVRSKLTYCSPLWRPHLLKDIKAIETIHRRATKYILNDYCSSYKTRLISLHLLPLMMQFEINDILLFVTCIKNPTSSFDISQFVSFSSCSTRSSSHFKLNHNLCTSSYVKHFYFNRLPRLWNSLPVISFEHSINSIKHKLKSFFWHHFMETFNPNDPCTFHFLCPCSKCVSLPVVYNFDDLVP